jgi:hypothetical protein
VKMPWQVEGFVLLSGPGRLWVWLCAKVCGMEVVPPPDKERMA